METSGDKMMSRQKGVAAVEFALIAMLFFILLFGIIELGRLFYVWNSVQEVTRRAAREAVVTDFTDATALTAVKRDALLGGDTLIAAPEVGSVSVRISYLDLSGNPIASNSLPVSPTENAQACVDENSSANGAKPYCIAYVQACLANDSGCATSVRYLPMVSLFPYFNLNIPVSTVTMPAESMGYVP